MSVVANSALVDEFEGSVKHQLADHYGVKSDEYYSRARSAFVEELPDDPNAVVLDIGCGNGATGKMALELGKCARYCGVELTEEFGSAARDVLSEVVIGNVETDALPWPSGTFDAVFMSEVLEHLVDPWAAVSRMAELMKPGARIMASSPNIAHYRVIQQQLRGRWDLTDEGVMDRTHLRWFTPDTFQAMFEDAGFEVYDRRPVAPLGPKARVLSKLTGGAFDHLLMVQIQIFARKR